MTKPTNTLMNELHIRYADGQTVCLVLYKIKGMERRSKVDAFSEYVAKLEQFTIYKQKDDFGREQPAIEEMALVPQKIQKDVIDAFLDDDFILASIFKALNGTKCINTVIRLPKTAEIIDTDGYFG